MILIIALAFIFWYLSFVKEPLEVLVGGLKRVDVVKIIVCSSNQASEWVRNVITVTLNVAWLFVPDGLV